MELALSFAGALSRTVRFASIWFHQAIFEEVERDLMKITEDPRAHVDLPERSSRCVSVCAGVCVCSVHG